MRMIGGKFKGRQLASPKGKWTRPSTERLREALYNIVAPTIGEAQVLDLFAGTGAIGLEALSRGAAHATFVEQSPAALYQNIETLGVADRCRVMAIDVDNALAQLTASFDLIYADPPYGQTAADLYRWLTLIEDRGLLAPEGQLFVEEASSLDDLPLLAQFELKQVRRYGRTHLWEFVWGDS